MAFPTTSTVIDSFNRSDAANLGANWSQEPFNDSTTGAFKVVSNQAVKQSTSFSYEMVWWNPATYGPVSEAWVTVATVDPAAYVYLHLRTVSPSSSSSTGDGYLFEQVQGTGNAIYRMDNGVSTMLGARMTVTNLSSGDKYGAEAVGSTFQAYRYTGGAWAAYGTPRIDTTYTAAGYIGFGNYDNTGSGTSAFDDFGGGTGTTVAPYIAGYSSAIQSDLSGAATVTVTLPAHATNDILIVAATNDAGGVLSCATSGWAEITEVDAADNFAWYWKRAASGSETSPVVEAAGTDVFCAAFVVRGCVTSGTPYEDATASSMGTDSTPDGSTITTTSTNRLAVTIANINDDTAWSSEPPPSGWVTAMDVSTGDGTGARFAVITQTKATAGDVTGATVGTLATSENWATLSLAFIPEPTGTTYEKTGNAQAAASASGAAVVDWVKTGNAQSAGVASGASTQEWAKTGSGVAEAAVSADEATDYTKSGSSEAGAAASGDEATDYAKTGYAVADAAASGPKAVAKEKAGSAATGLVASGVHDVDWVKSGSGAAEAAASGDEATDYSKAGAAEAGAAASGAGVQDWVKTGASEVGAVASGADVVEGFTTYEKTGSAQSAFVASGDEATDYVKAGGPTSDAVASGVSVQDWAKTGSGVVGAVCAAAKVVTGAATYEKTGKTVSEWAASASMVYERRGTRGNPTGGGRGTTGGGSGGGRGNEGSPDPPSTVLLYPDTVLYPDTILYPDGVADGGRDVAGQLSGAGRGSVGAVGSGSGR